MVRSILVKDAQRMLKNGIARVVFDSAMSSSERDERFRREGTPHWLDKGRSTLHVVASESLHLDEISWRFLLLRLRQRTKNDE